MICDTSFSFCEIGQNVPQFDIDPYARERHVSQSFDTAGSKVHSRAGTRAGSHGNGAVFGFTLVHAHTLSGSREAIILACLRHTATG